MTYHTNPRSIDDMARPLYNLLITVLTPLLVLRLFYKSLREPNYRRQWWRRFAHLVVHGLKFLAPVLEPHLDAARRELEPLGQGTQKLLARQRSSS